MHRSTMRPGCTYVTITIDKIGLKNPHDYIDPFITVSVKSKPVAACTSRYTRGQPHFYILGGAKMRLGPRLIHYLVAGTMLIIGLQATCRSPGCSHRADHLVAGPVLITRLQPPC